MKIVDTAKKALGGDKDKHKGKDFMKGLKDWITSPGGIMTVVLIVATIWYVHHKTSPKGAKA